MKPNNKFNQTGFTLAETLIVTFLIGIFAAMGTPNFLGYQANQRLNDTNEQLYNILISTQEKAKKESLAYTVALQQNGLIPQYKVYPKQANIATIPTSPSWKNLTKNNEFKLVLNQGSKIIFDYQGKIDSQSELQTNEKIDLTFQNSSQTAKKCIIVKTKFGYLYTTQDAFCQ